MSPFVAGFSSELTKLALFERPLRASRGIGSFGARKRISKEKLLQLIEWARRPSRGIGARKHATKLAMGGVAQVASNLTEPSIKEDKDENYGQVDYGHGKPMQKRRRTGHGSPNLVLDGKKIDRKSTRLNSSHTT